MSVIPCGQLFKLISRAARPGRIVAQGPAYDSLLNLKRMINSTRHILVMISTAVLVTSLSSFNISARSSSDETPLDDDIHVNQIGVQPGQLKQVIIAGELRGDRKFQIVNRQSRVVFESSLENFGFDSDSGEGLWRGDFTAFRLPGAYRIRVAGRGSSYPFVIAGNVNRNVTRLAARWFYLQRSGVEVRDTATGVEHNADYLEAAFLRDEHGVVSTERFDTSGGWWDAGDYGRYVPTAASSIVLLMYAYHFNPHMFRDGSLDIPESGNGVPDLLDEIRWELEWLLKMQRSDGAVHQKTATRDYAEVSPGRDTQQIYLFDVTSQATAQFAGALSEASVIYRNNDRKFADRLLAAARRAWVWLEANPGKYPIGGFRNPDDENGGDYAVTGDETQQRLWAAGGLFHATGEQRYKNAFAELWARHDRAAEVYGLSWPDGYVFAMFAYLHRPDGSERIKKEIKETILQQTEKILSVSKRTGYGVALSGKAPPFGYGWGSNCLALSYGIYLLLGNELAPKLDLVNGAAAQLNWVLGVNPLNKAFITGAGSNPIRSPHHMLSILRGSPVPGAIGEGPNAMAIGGDPVLKELFAANVPFAKRYVDDAGSWATNEPTIDANAAFVAVAAWFAK